MAGLPEDGGGVGGHYNGKLESPALFDRALEPALLDAVLASPLPAWLRRQVVGAWDFSAGITTTRVIDQGPLGLDGELVNLPARAMKGWNWTGETIRWTDKPEHYGAVHFHEDDLYDSGWEVDFAFAVPDGPAQRRLCRARLVRRAPSDGTEEDYIAFFVRPPRGPKGRTGGPRRRSWCRPAATWPMPTTTSHPTRARAEMLMGRLLVISARRPLSAGAPRARRLALRHPCRRQRRVLLLAAAADPQHAAQIPVLARRPRLRPLAVQRRHPPHRLAGAQGRRLRLHHRRGSARGGRRAAQALPRRADRHPSGVPLQAHVGRHAAPGRSAAGG